MTVSISPSSIRARSSCRFMSFEFLKRSFLLGFGDGAGILLFWRYTYFDWIGRDFGPLRRTGLGRIEREGRSHEKGQSATLEERRNKNAVSRDKVGQGTAC